MISVDFFDSEGKKSETMNLLGFEEMLIDISPD
jgi:hypothetical protein